MATNCKPEGFTTSWQKVSFGHVFATEPALLTSVQSLNNEVGLPSSSQPWFTAPRPKFNG